MTKCLGSVVVELVKSESSDFCLGRFAKSPVCLIAAPSHDDRLSCRISRQNNDLSSS